MPLLWRYNRRARALIVPFVVSRLIVCVKDIGGRYGTCLSVENCAICTLVRRRFFCHDCNRAFSESLDFVQGRRDYTNRYQDRIFHHVKENNITVVQHAEALTYDQIESIFLH